MPVVSCPKCTAGLRVPDGATASVRCPKCQTIFQPPQPKSAARPPAPPRPAPRPAAPSPSADFEVVEETPPPAPKSPPAAPKKAFSLDEAVRSADPPRARRAARDDDRDRDRDDRDRDRDDRDRRRDDRRRRDDEDDDDRRPRGRSSRVRDDYDDDYDRRDDYDDDYDRRDRGRRPSRFGVARPGVLLILISVGLYFGGMALHALFLFLAWVGAVIPSGLVVVTGVLGLAGWVVALVGFGLSIAGPSKVRGLAIAATSVAVVHLILAFVVANNRQSILFGSHSILSLSAMNRAERIQDIHKELTKEMQANPSGPRVKDLQAELAAYSRDRGRALDGDGLDGMRWDDLITNLPRLDKLIAVLVYSSREFEYYLWGLFAGLLELARLVLLGLLLGALARAAKDHRAADQAKFGWIAGAVAVGVSMLVVVLAAVMAESAAKDMAKGLTADLGGGPPMPQFTPGGDFRQQQADFQQRMDDWRRQQETSFERQQQRFRSLQRSVKNWSAGGELLVFTLHAGALILPGLSAFGVFQSMGRRR